MMINDRGRYAHLLEFLTAPAPEDDSSERRTWETLRECVSKITDYNAVIRGLLRKHPVTYEGEARLLA